MRFRLEFAWQPAHRGRTVSQAGCDARSGEKSLERLGAESRFRPSSPSIGRIRSEEHTSELQSREDISYAAFCVKKKQQMLGGGNQHAWFHQAGGVTDACDVSTRGLNLIFFLISGRPLDSTPFPCRPLFE